MAYEFALYEKKGRIAYITMNRTEVLNALHPPANLELEQIWHDFSDDPEVWVAIVTGAGDRAFSAGNDLKYTAEHGGASTGPRSPFGGITSDFECWKPVIAAVKSALRVKG